MSRSKWKNPFTKHLSSKNKKRRILSIERNYEITPNMLGKTFKAHNGKTLVKLNISDEMIGYKVGEFIPTRVKFMFKKKRKTNKK